ncbi:HNH endonuclease [Granulosicoccus antarcticus]|nr:HNH endonuclease signature motif containing protein [Granulosicoccus antarcticus]
MAMPDEAPAIARRLKQIGEDISSGMADQLELLVRFDDLEGWNTSGSRHCAAWMNLELSISLQLGWEYLRVGRKLRSLPITQALFRAGKLTWSIVRLLSRVANKDNEALLCHTALDASVSDVERLVNEYRWQQDAEQNMADGENARSLQQIEARSFGWSSASNGNTLIKLSLPPEIAQAFLNSVEQSLAQLEESDASMTQRRADAAILMAENSLQNAGREMATADRYQVIVSVDASELPVNKPTEQDQQPPSSPIPTKRPIVNGAGPIAIETARRLACDCSISTITHQHGEPLDIGRKSRLWPPAMARAIKNRDQHCQYSGCTQTRHLQIHHIQHWADGGSTCVDNGICLCSKHHTFVHEGGYRIERVNDLETAFEEQFIRQQATEQTDNEIEKALRNSRESFELVRQSDPTRFRFRVVNKDGLDIRDISEAQKSEKQRDEFAESNYDNYSTRVDQPLYDCQQKSGRDTDTLSTHWPGVAEQAECYCAAHA